MSRYNLNTISEKRFIAFLISIWLLFRIIYLVCLPAGDYVSDPKRYVSLAESILDGDGYVAENGNPTAYVPPGAAIALLPPLLLGHRWAIDVYYCILSLIALLIFYRIFRLGQSGKGSSRLAAIILAIVPSWIFYSGIPNAELPFIILSGAAILSAMNRGLINLIISGVLIGGVVLTKPIGLFLIPLILLFQFSRDKSLKLSLKSLSLISLGTILIVSPWIARNKIVMGTAAISTNTGANLFIGANDAATGYYLWEETNLNSLNEVEQNRFFARSALEWMSKKPLRWFALAPLKIFWLWIPEFEGVVWRNTQNRTSKNIAIFLGQFLWLGILIPAFAIIFRPSKIANDNLAALFAISIIGLSLFHAVFFGAGRFHSIAAPAISYLSAYFFNFALLHRSTDIEKTLN